MNSPDKKRLDEMGIGKGLQNQLLDLATAPARARSSIRITSGMTISVRAANRFE
jgi:hypothetical protein